MPFLMMLIIKHSKSKAKALDSNTKAKALNSYPKAKALDSKTGVQSEALENFGNFKTSDFMSQLTLLKKILLIVSFVVIASCNPSSEPAISPNSSNGSAKTFSWKMVTAWPPNFPIFQEGAEQFAKNIEVMSNGRLKIQVFAGGQLVPALEVFDVVSQGSVQMGHAGAFFWAGKIPAAQFMSAMPFGMTANGMNAWLYEGGGLALWRELYEPFNLIPFPAGNTGVQMGGWFRHKIETIEDLKGLKMRIPGLGSQVLAKAGVTTRLLAGGEIYTALERGVIDATEWAAPFHDMRFGFPKIAKYYYYPGWHEPGTALELIVNRHAFEELSADLQKIIEVASRSLNQLIYAEFEALNSQALQKLKLQKDIEILPFPPEVIKEIKRLTEETLTQEAAKDSTFAKVYEAYKTFQAEHAGWNAISEEAYHQSLR
jgi:TRAP-type mannitol/chloroaromatic compound transport system substrate-binding protein